MAHWLEQEPLLRLIPFAGVFALMAIWEILASRRPLSIGKLYRWVNNLGIALISSLLLRLLFPAAAVGVASFVEAQRWGLFYLPVFAQWPLWVKTVIGLLLMDFAIWGQHVLLHATPALWRLHRMHHTDQDFDVTTGLRFHPLEILLSMAIKATVILALGIPAVTVLIFEILLNATSLFNHGNVRLPAGLDRCLRWVLVTPDMHRVHHSWHTEETNSNYGFNLPWWDRLLGTYRAQPRDGHIEMTIGIHQFREYRDQRLDRLLLQPLVRTAQGPLVSEQPQTRGPS